jgi:hypothetical protein
MFAGTTDDVADGHEAGAASAWGVEVPIMTTRANLISFVAQQLPGRFIDEVQSATRRTSDGIIFCVFVVRRGVVLQPLLNIQTGKRASK